MHENREISGASRSKQDRDRSAKAQSHNADMHVTEKSDCAVLPMNQPNKGELSPAEVGEERARTKENIVQSNTTSRRATLSAPGCLDAVFSMLKSCFSPRLESKANPLRTGQGSSVLCPVLSFLPYHRPLAVLTGVPLVSDTSSWIESRQPNRSGCDHLAP